jgi:hypothetical protein
MITTNMRLIEILKAVALSAMYADRYGHAYVVAQNGDITTIASGDDVPDGVTPVCTVLPNGDVQLHTDRPIDPDAIPFPKRPGTLWQCDPPRQGGHLRCVHCRAGLQPARRAEGRTGKVRAAGRHAVASDVPVV